jgi:hypothetical protein
MPAWQTQLMQTFIKPRSEKPENNSALQLGL